jgi:hypothetical protein
MIDFACPHCDKRLKVKYGAAGKRVRCPACERPAEVQARTGKDATHRPGHTGDEADSYSRMKPGVSDLGPLSKMKLRRLTLGQIRRIRSIKPLAEMPLEWLSMEAPEVDDYTPLRKMPLKHLDLVAGHISDLGVLRGTKLEYLNLSFCRNLSDLAPLSGMPLRRLVLNGCLKVEDIGPLAGSPITDLDLPGTAIRDVKVLAKMKLTRLWLENCKQLESLEGLHDGMPLAHLNLDGCQKLKSIAPLKGIKLVELGVMRCPGVTDLSPLAGMPLRSIRLSPRQITKDNMRALLALETLREVTVEGKGKYDTPKFRELYEAGEFEKKP